MFVMLLVISVMFVMMFMLFAAISTDTGENEVGDNKWNKKANM